MIRKSIPQLGAATALVQLLTEHPELPMLDWSLPDGDGPLAGNVLNDDVDMRPVIAAYEAAIGGEIREHEYRGADGQLRYSAHLSATWRDVRITVFGVCSASAHVAVAA